MSFSSSVSHYFPLVWRGGWRLMGNVTCNFPLILLHAQVEVAALHPAHTHTHTLCLSFASLVVYYFRWHLSLHLPSLVTSAACPRQFKCSAGSCMLIERREDAKQKSNETRGAETYMHVLQNSVPLSLHFSWTICIARILSAICEAQMCKLSKVLSRDRWSCGHFIIAIFLAHNDHLGYFNEKIMGNCYSKKRIVGQQACNNVTFSFS